MGITYLSADGHGSATRSARASSREYAYCFKCFPSCEKGKGFDCDPLLVRLEWHHRSTPAPGSVEGELALRESPLDPVADLPVRRLVRIEYEEGSTQSNGKVLRSVPGEWLLPFLHQRYDDASGEGIDV